MSKYTLTQNGQQVQEAINKIIALGPATYTTEGLMTAFDKAKIDSFGISVKTEAEWDAARGYIPSAGEIVIYSDRPGIKIGSGNAYVQDLAFLGEGSEELARHIADDIAHTTAEEKRFWNRKLNVTDNQEVVDEILIFNRN